MNQIFISYAKEDRAVAEELYHDLKNNGFHPWIDVVNLLPGQEWELEIKKAINNSSIFIACLSSNSVSKRGFVQSELKSALKVLNTIPEGHVYLIPVRLEECGIPKSIEHLQWVDHFQAVGQMNLISALRQYIGANIEKIQNSHSGPIKGMGSGQANIPN